VESCLATWTSNGVEKKNNEKILRDQRFEGPPTIPNLEERV